MSFSAIVAIVVFLVSVVLSQKIGVNAATKLDDENKLKIAAIFPKRNVNYTIIVFCMVIVFLISIYLFPQYLTAITIAYGVACVIYIFGKLFLNVRKLREISAPEPYIRSVIISFAVFIGGAAAAAIVLAVGNAGNLR